jgi:hypothetical protein
MNYPVKQSGASGVSQELSERDHHIVNELHQLMHKWENRLKLDNPRLMERYCEGKLRVLVRLRIGQIGKDFVACFQRFDGARALPVEVLWAARDAFDERLLDLTLRPRAVLAHRRLARHLWRHAESWFSFLTEPSIPATNWPAEQALRPAVVNRRYGAAIGP